VQSAFEQVSRRAGGASASSPVIENLAVRLAELEREAAGLAATFHDDYPKLVELRRQIQAVERALNNENQRVVTRAQRDYEAALRKEGLLQAALNQQQRAAQALEGSSASYASMKRAVATDQQLYATLDQKLKEVSISSALQATNAGIVDAPTPPLAPYGSPLALNLALGLILGVLAGIGGAVLREHLDGSIRHMDDVHGVYGVPALAAIPSVSGGLRSAARGLIGGTPIVLATARRGRQRWHRISASTRQQSALADAFTSLRAAVLLKQDAAGARPRSLLVTSPGPGEGKTTVSVNLALSLARLNQRVLLVDADMRRPAVHEAFGLADGPGLTSYLACELEWPMTVRANVFQDLDVIPTGFGGTSTGDLLSSERMRRLVLEASERYDFVIVDSPPLMVNVPDARILSRLTDGVLLTVRSGATSRERVWHALSQVHAVVGIVVNAFDMGEDQTSYYAPYGPDVHAVAN
jgi:capsular exopolysaccharide synthesis family protein